LLSHQRKLIAVFGFEADDAVN